LEIGEGVFTEWFAEVSEEEGFVEGGTDKEAE